VFALLLQISSIIPHLQVRSNVSRYKLVFIVLYTHIVWLPLCVPRHTEILLSLGISVYFINWTYLCLETGHWYILASNADFLIVNSVSIYFLVNTHTAHFNSSTPTLCYRQDCGSFLARKPFNFSSITNLIYCLNCCSLLKNVR
jgi:hypothetical protein